MKGSGKEQQFIVPFHRLFLITCLLTGKIALIILKANAKYAEIDARQVPYVSTGRSDYGS